MIGEFKQCKPFKSGNLLVELNTADQVRILLEEKRFAGYNVKVNIAELVGTVRGVIYEPRLVDKSIEYITHKLYSQGVVKVRPIEKLDQNTNQRNRTPLIVLTFKKSKLPKTIYLSKEIKYVRPYNIRPSQCKKCYRFGHWKDTCTKQEVCENCGIEGDHNSTQCSLPMRCCLCQQNHKATDRSCPKWKKQEAIAKIRTEHQVSYRSAYDILIRQQSTAPAMTAVGASWGPPLPLASDTDRQVNPVNPIRSKTPYIQRVTLKPKHKTKRPLKTSSTYSDSSEDNISFIDTDVTQNIPGIPSGSKKNHTGEKTKFTKYTDDSLIHAINSGKKPTYANHTGEKLAYAKSTGQPKKMKYANDLNKYLKNNSYESIDSQNPQNMQYTGKPIVIREKIKKVYVKDVAVQTQTNAETQMEPNFILYGSKVIADLINHIGKNTIVVNGKPSFQCKPIAEKLTSLTGIPIEPSWVVNVLRQ